MLCQQVYFIPWFSTLIPDFSGSENQTAECRQLSPVYVTGGVHGAASSPVPYRGRAGVCTGDQIHVNQPLRCVQSTAPALDSPRQWPSTNLYILFSLLCLSPSDSNRRSKCNQSHWRLNLFWRDLAGKAERKAAYWFYSDAVNSGALPWSPMLLV